jgi:hypothetical protein
MDLVNVSHRAIAFREVADAVHRRDVAVHGIKRLERDQLGLVGRLQGEQFFEVADVVVTPDFSGYASFGAPLSSLVHPNEGRRSLQIGHGYSLR